MKQSNKNFLVLFIVVIAVFGFSAINQYRHSKDMNEFGTDVVIGAGKPVMLELGSHTCVPCRKMMSVLRELDDKYSDKLGIKFIDVNANVEAAEKYNINLIPTQVFLDGDGNELFRHVGYYAESEIVAKCKELGIDLESDK